MLQANPPPPKTSPWHFFSKIDMRVTIFSKFKTTHASKYIWSIAYTILITLCKQTTLAIIRQLPLSYNFTVLTMSHPLKQCCKNISEQGGSLNRVERKRNRLKRLISAIYVLILWGFFSNVISIGIISKLPWLK